jgi:hypothetical protein
MRNIVKKYAFPILDIILAPAIVVSAILLKFARTLVLNHNTMAFGHAKLSKSIFEKVGVFPIIDHYIDPLFQKKNLKRPLSTERDLPGIHWDFPGQVELISGFNYEDELIKYPFEKPKQLGYYYNAVAFNSGDAEILYSMVRHFKPGRIIEIGCGMSTLIAVDAVRTNKVESKSYTCDYTCIEPYHEPWLESIKEVKVHRELVENLNYDMFKELNENDILFIDSSHIIRPQGDVSIIYLEILPLLKPGVIVHIHDIFSPADMHEGFLFGSSLLYNEQYLLEAFLTCNPSFKVIGALSYLKRHYPELMTKKCPGMRKQFELQEPRSFWIKRVS